MSPTLVTLSCLFFFFFNDTATTEIYTLSLHDALPISPRAPPTASSAAAWRRSRSRAMRAEEHTAELQSQSNLVGRLLLEKKKKKQSARVEREERSGHVEVRVIRLVL